MEKELQDISGYFFRQEHNFADLRQACGNYKDFLIRISGMDISGSAEREHLCLDSGTAIGTSWAAMCLDDLLRTAGFIRGTFKAVQLFLARYPDRTVHLLYAGAGPFAALVLPLTRVFTPAQLQLTLIEVNPVTYRNLERVIAALDLEKFVRRLVPADATTYCLPPGEPVDILLSETMQAGLRKEAQVAIFFHFLAQEACKEALLIPQSVRLELGYWRSYRAAAADQEDKTRRNIGCYAELNKDNILKSLGQNRNGEPGQPFYPVSFQCSPEEAKGFDRLAVFTEIDIFQDEKLTLNQSGLTIPLMLRDLTRNPLRKGRIKVSYRLSADPSEEVGFEPDQIFFSE